MELNNEFQPIRDWGISKGIISKGDMKTQCLKLVTEVGELAEAILNNDQAEIEDAIGDCSVVLTLITKLASNHFQDNSINIEKCINGAYNIISKRKGEMRNGTFVKEETKS